MESKKVFSERLKIFLSDLNRIIKKNGVGIVSTVYFKGKNKVPFLSKIAIYIIKKQGGSIIPQFVDLV